MEFTAQEQADLAAHEEILAELLRTADEFLPQHPEQELCPRQAALLERLEAAFAGLSCPAGISLLSGGLAEDDWRAPRVVEYINATDETPRHDWKALTPQMLRACEDSLFFIEAPAFCYVLPAYLRQYLLRPDFMCMDSIFHCMDYACKGQYLLSLSPEQKAVVQDVLNEFRCREQQINGDVEETLLPWEYEHYRQEGGDTSPWTFAGNQTLEYAERHGIPY